MNLYLTKPTRPAAASPALWRINENDRTPKFLQLVNGVIAGIEQGVLKPGDRLPSINETSVEYLLARATVEKAYGLLQEMGHVASLQRKGYFIQGQRTARRVMLLVGQVDAATGWLCHDLGQALGPGYKVDVFVHAYKKAYFCEALENQVEHYHAFVLHPEHLEPCERVRRVLNKIPQDRLVWLDGAAQTGAALRCLLDQQVASFARYGAARLVTSDHEYVPAEWLQTFEAFFAERGIDYRVLDDFEDETVQAHTAYLVVDNSDLVRILRQMQERGWQAGREIGLLAYLDEPFKELLAGGISTFGPDTRQTARTIAEKLRQGTRQTVPEVLHWQRRASL